MLIVQGKTPAPLKLTLKDKVGCTGVLIVQARGVCHLNDDWCPTHCTHWKDGEDTPRPKDILQCEGEAGILSYVSITHHQVQARQRGSIGC